MPLAQFNFLHERRRSNELAIDPVENIEKAIPVSLHEQIEGSFRSALHPPALGFQLES
jgi:hypothetical protein